MFAPIRTDLKSVLQPDYGHNEEVFMGIKRNLLRSNEGYLVRTPGVVNTTITDNINTVADRFNFTSTGGYSPLFVMGINKLPSGPIGNDEWRLEASVAEQNGSLRQISMYFGGKDPKTGKWTWVKSGSLPSTIETLTADFSPRRTFFLPGITQVDLNPSRVYFPPVTKNFLIYNGQTASVVTIPSNVANDAFLNAAVVWNQRMFVTGFDTIYFSDVANISSWNPLNFFTSEAIRDEATGLWVSQNLLYVFGGDSIEVWQNDGVNPFSRIQRGVINVGSALRRHPPIVDQDTCFLLTQRGEIYEVGGQGSLQKKFPLSVSTGEFSVITGDFGSHYKSRMDLLKYLGKRYLCYVGQALSNTAQLIDIDNDDFSLFDDGTILIDYPQTKPIGGEIEIQGITYSESVNSWYVANSTIPQVACLSYAKGVSLAGNTVTAQFQTAWIRRGTDALKQCLRIRIQLWYDGSGNYPTYTIRYRNNGETAWKATRIITLNLSSSRGFQVITLHDLGAYRSRQWEIYSQTTNSEIIIGSIEEEFEIQPYS